MHWNFALLVAKKWTFLSRFAILKAPFQICNADISETLYWQVLKFSYVNVVLGTFLSVTTVSYFRISEKGTRRRLRCTCASFFIFIGKWNTNCIASARIHTVLPTPLRWQTRHIWQHCNPKNKFVLQNLHQRYHRCGWSWRWIIWRRFEYFTILRLLVCCGSIVFAFVTIR